MKYIIIIRWRNSSGDEYDGIWCNDRPHGYGVRTYSDGTEYSGQWKNGNRIDQESLFGKTDIITGLWEEGGDEEEE